MVTTQVWTTAGCRLLAVVLFAQMTFLLTAEWRPMVGEWAVLLNGLLVLTLGGVAWLLWRQAEGAARMVLSGERVEAAGDDDKRAHQQAAAVVRAGRTVVGVAVMVAGGMFLVDIALGVVLGRPHESAPSLTSGVMQMALGLWLALGWAGMGRFLMLMYDCVGRLRRAGTRKADGA